MPFSIPQTGRSFLKRFRQRHGAGRRPVPDSRTLSVELLENRTLLTGTWTPLTSVAPDRIATMMLLSDGTVLAHASMEGHMTRDWYRLTPDASGSYVDGTWSQLASMQDTRVYYPSEVLPDGRVVVMGGEYGTGTRTSEIYDPLADTWTLLPARPLGDIGDVPSEILPDGRVIVGYRSDGRTNTYDPVSNTWTVSATKLGNNSSSSEESWMLLPDQSILTVETFNPPHAQKYLPAEDRWVDAGNLPFNIIEGSEIGAGLLLPDGRAFFIGANGKTAYYNPPADSHDPGSWDAGPSIPNNGGAWDAPAAIMPNGKVLMATGPRNYNGPTTLYEFDPATETYTHVDSPPFNGPPYEGRMLILPSGQVLWSYSNSQLYVYTPDGAPDPSWKPAISDVADNGDGSFLLTGTQLGGINEGAAYGDDAEMSSNYPIVQLVDGDGNVFYARTFNWSNTGVMTGDTPVATSFTLPDGFTAGTYSLYVIANGIASDPVPFTVGGNAPSHFPPVTHRPSKGTGPTADAVLGPARHGPAPIDIAMSGQAFLGVMHVVSRDLALVIPSAEPSAARDTIAPTSWADEPCHRSTCHSSDEAVWGHRAASDAGFAEEWLKLIALG